MKSAAQALMSALESARSQGEKISSSQDAQASGECSNPTADGLKLLRAFLNIRDATLRRSVVHLVELLAAQHAKG